MVQIAGSENSGTGGRTSSLDLGSDPSISKIRVRQPSDVLGLVDPGLIAERLSKADAEKITKAAQMMSGRQLAKFQAKDLPNQVKDLVECGYLGSKDLISSDAAGLDPTGDADFAAIFNLANSDDQAAWIPG